MPHVTLSSTLRSRAVVVVAVVTTLASATTTSPVSPVQAAEPETVDRAVRDNCKGYSCRDAAHGDERTAGSTSESRDGTTHAPPTEPPLSPAAGHDS
jgi:hypothetical protein